MTEFISQLSNTNTKPLDMEKWRLRCIKRRGFQISLFNISLVTYTSYCLDTACSNQSLDNSWACFIWGEVIREAI